MSVLPNDGNRDGAPGAERLLADAMRAAQGAHDRLANVLIDFFLPDAHRASDRTRATMARLLDQLVGALEADLRASLAEDFADSPSLAAALNSGRVAIAMPILARSKILRDGDLIGLLLARAEEHRIVAGLLRIAEADAGDELPAPPLIDDPETLADDTALRLAEARRFDRSHEAAIDPRDLPADLLHRLLWWIAAALRDYMVRVHDEDAARVDQAIVVAATARLTGHDEGEAMDALAMRLARRWHMLGVDSDIRLHDALRHGRFALFVAMLAVRGGIAHDVSRAMAADPGIERLAVLLKATAVGRDVAVSILFEMAAINGLPEPLLIDCVDDLAALHPADAREAIRPWRLDRGYRSAVADLSAGLANAR